MEKTNNKPIYKARSGTIQGAVFEHKGKTDAGKEYTFYSTKIVKSYPKEKDNSGKVTEWAETNTYNKEDLMGLSVVLRKIEDFLFLTE